MFFHFMENDGMHVNNNFLYFERVVTVFEATKNMFSRNSLSIYANFSKAWKNARSWDAEVHSLDLFGQAKV